MHIFFQEKRCNISLNEVYEDCIHTDFFKEKISQFRKKSDSSDQLCTSLNEMTTPSLTVATAVGSEVIEHTSPDNADVDRSFLPTGDIGDDSIDKEVSVLHSSKNKIGRKNFIIQLSTAPKNKEVY